MKIIQQNNISVAQLVFLLQQGKVLAMPTETAYGLIADSANPSAVKKIYLIKGRNYSKPLPLICSSLFQVKKFFFLPRRLEIIARKYWPAALSLQLKVKGREIKVRTYRSTLVVRVSANHQLRKIAARLGNPLTATSANISGRKELYSAREVGRQFAGSKWQPDVVIDAGKLPKIKPSTIIALAGGDLKVLRQGEIKIFD